MSATTALAPFRARWQALGPREQTLVRWASMLVALALIWWVGIAPALNTLKAAQTQQSALAADLDKMQRLRSQALAIQAQPKIDRGEAVRTLESLVRQRLGPTAQLNVNGDRATLTLRNAPAGELAQWLSQVRVNARAVPSEVRLARSGGAAPTLPAAPAAASTWDGTLVLSLAPP
jgi:general secretion pathway protein M